MVILIKNTDGLKPQHISEMPLFEKVYTPLEYGDKLVSRVYNDGSLYYLTQDRENFEYVVKGEEWKFIGYLSEKGIKEIKLKIDAICKNILPISLQNNAFYELHWKMNCKGEMHEFVISDVSHDQNEMFDEITEIVNSE
jgi:hypothetical protein